MPFSIDWHFPTVGSSLPPRRLVAGPDLEPYGASGQPFNEIVVDATGRAGGHAGLDAVGGTRAGIVSVVLPDGSSCQVADDVWFPNGMVVLGEDTLVLAESRAPADRLDDHGLR
jgi:hypothetical protein